MIAYKASDVKISWEHSHGDNGENIGPRTCGYVKEGAGEFVHIYHYYLY